jgi:uncharacterized phage-like protein YoqJ
MIVGWTGHRPDLFRDPQAASASVAAAARDLVAREHVDAFLVGGQRGVDTWAARAAMSLDVPFTLILPLDVSEFTADWATSDRDDLEQIIATAADVRVAGGYTERNRQIATGADLLVAVWTRIGRGGAAETVALARAAGTPVNEIVLDPAPAAGSARGRGI